MEFMQNQMTSPAPSGLMPAVSLMSPEGNLENVAIALGGQPVGQATVVYEGATATVTAHVKLQPPAMPEEEFEHFHEEFARELMAFMANRGAMAQELEGSITYQIGPRSETLPLPSNPEVGLGYPNSW